MLSERENRRLHEIEVQLRLTDPRLVRRIAALNTALHAPARRGGNLLSGFVRDRRTVHGAGPFPTMLLGAVLVSVPVVVAGILPSPWPSLPPPGPRPGRPPGTA
ncbi:DUF3040 domain-containing protein [Pseudonocardia sp. ICBG1293]|uniref:DUF3040 domain-containing protein n=1 Tax=Pseudonocardia sp. ICBG1293 TaxID=2844382 RepID=UPI001CCF43EE|nr:DUF3040 domain-containing protein [Pseudonocardia sp. ICBG1293]